MMVEDGSLVDEPVTLLKFEGCIVREVPSRNLKAFNWSYNPSSPKRAVMELATLQFVDAREDALIIGKPGTGKSQVAKALAMLAVNRGDKVIYREAHQRIEDIHEARALGQLRKLRTQLHTAHLLVIDNLFL